MDELLELMEADAPADEEEPISRRDKDDLDEDVGGIDELTSLMFEEEDDGTLPSELQHHPHVPSKLQTLAEANKVIVTPNVTCTKVTTKCNNVRGARTAAASSKPVGASVDDRLGIRMLHRLVSSNDLLELITDHPYFPPASLSAMPLAKLNTLLLDPARIVDPATVAGKMNLVTVGLVFSNSGTRISSKGGGFCVLTIGNFASGPCLTIFLFGDAYGKYCRTCTAGKVIALMGPKLLPSSRKDNKSNQYNDNPVSFSVYESGQLQIVANARDYGTCQGKVRVKQPDGMWSSNGHCKQWVDKRVSEYCQQHRRQQLKASVVAVNGKIKPMNTFQQLKVQTVRTPQAMAHLTMRTASTSQAPASNNRLILSQKASNDMSFLSSATPRNSLQPEATSDLARHVPMHMKKQINPPLVEQRTNAKVSVMHRLKNKRMTAAPTSTASSNDASSGNQGKRPLSTLAGDWLQEAVTDAKKAKPATRMASKSLSSYMKNGFKNGGSGKRVNVAGLGLDGSVVVPQPSRIFQGREATAFTTHTSASSGPSLVEKQEQLLQRQREFAQRRKEALASRNSTQEKAPSSNHMFRKQPGHDKTSASDALQEMFGDIDHEKVRNAKSRFSTEIEAEEYAASRQKIVELEKLEERKNKADANKNKNDEKRLIKEWRCKTCARNFSFKPKSCYKAGHEIVTVRNIRKDGTKEEMRTKMHSKKVEDGGLQLGAGLEWSDRFGGKNRFVA